MKTTVTNCNGKFFFSPKRPGLKKVHRSFDSAIILKVDNGITDYYSWWLWRKYNINLSRPAWGTHITVVSDKDRVTDLKKFEELKSKLNTRVVKIGYDVKVEKKWQFWVLPVIPSEELIEIRKSLNLKEDYPFHITIGRDDHAS